MSQNITKENCNNLNSHQNMLDVLTSFLRDIQTHLKNYLQEILIKMDKKTAVLPEKVQEKYRNVKKNETFENMVALI